MLSWKNLFTTTCLKDNLKSSILHESFWLIFLQTSQNWSITDAFNLLRKPIETGPEKYHADDRVSDGLLLARKKFKPSESPFSFSEASRMCF